MRSDYLMRLEIRSSDEGGGVIPLEVCREIRDKVNPLIGDEISLDDFCGNDGNSLDFRYEDSLGGGTTEREYFEGIAAAIRTIPGCGKDGKYGIEIEGGWTYPEPPEYEWVTGL